MDQLKNCEWLRGYNSAQNANGQRGTETEEQLSQSNSTKNANEQVEKTKSHSEEALSTPPPPPLLLPPATTSSQTALPANLSNTTCVTDLAHPTHHVRPNPAHLAISTHPAHPAYPNPAHYVNPVEIREELRGVIQAMEDCVGSLTGVGDNNNADADAATDADADADAGANGSTNADADAGEGARFVLRAGADFGVVEDAGVNTAAKADSSMGIAREGKRVRPDRISDDNENDTRGSDGDIENREGLHLIRSSLSMANKSINSEVDNFVSKSASVKEANVTPRMRHDREIISDRYNNALRRDEGVDVH